MQAYFNTTRINMKKKMPPNRVKTKTTYRQPRKLKYRRIQNKVYSK